MNNRASTSNIEQTDDSIQIPRDIESHEGKKAARALSVLAIWLRSLIRQIREQEVEKSATYEYVVDFDVIAEVALPKAKVYASAMSRAFDLIRRKGIPKLIIFNSSREEAEQFVEYQIQEFHKVLRLHRTLEIVYSRVPELGIFTDQYWEPLKKRLEDALRKTSTTSIERLSIALCDCCKPFTNLQIGPEEKYQEKRLFVFYLDELNQWANRHPAAPPRTSHANQVDSQNLAVIHSINSSSDVNCRLVMITTTRPLFDISSCSEHIELRNPLLFYLSLNLTEHFPNWLARLGFLTQCSIDISRLQNSLDFVNYHLQTTQSLSRNEVNDLMRTWRSLLAGKSHLFDLYRMLDSALAESSNAWLTASDEIQAQTPYVSFAGIVRTISGLRSLLAKLRGFEPGANLLSHFGGRWEEDIPIPSGIKRQLKFTTPECLVTIDRFHGYYSLYWDSDCTLLEFLDVIHTLAKNSEFKPDSLRIVTGEGEEFHGQYDLDGSLSQLKDLINGRLLSLLKIGSETTDIFYEVPKTAPISLSKTDAVNGTRVAIISKSLALDIASRLCEKTCRCYLSELDFLKLLAGDLELAFTP